MQALSLMLHHEGRLAVDGGCVTEWTERIFKVYCMCGELSESWCSDTARASWVRIANNGKRMSLMTTAASGAYSSRAQSTEYRTRKGTKRAGLSGACDMRTSPRASDPQG